MRIFQRLGPVLIPMLLEFTIFQGQMVLGLQGADRGYQRASITYLNKANLLTRMNRDFGGLCKAGI